MLDIAIGGDEILSMQALAGASSMRLEKSFSNHQQAAGSSIVRFALEWFTCVSLFIRDTAVGVSVRNALSLTRAFLRLTMLITMVTWRGLAGLASGLAVKDSNFSIVSFGKVSRKLFNSFVSTAILARPATAGFAPT